MNANRQDKARLRELALRQLRRRQGVDDGFVAETGWVNHNGQLYVNADDLIDVLRAAGWTEAAEDFNRIAEEQRRV